MQGAKEANSQREKILSCAVESFAENGYANTKIMDLAKKANVNHALIHYYFGSKEELYGEVVQLLFHAWGQDIKSVSWDGDNPREILSDYIRTYFGFHKHYQNLYSIRRWDKMEGRNEFSKCIDKYWSDDINQKSAAIEQWKQKGLIRESTNSTLFLFTIFAIMNEFYQYDDDHIRSVLGSKAEGDELYNEFSGYLSGMLLDGVLK